MDAQKAFREEDIHALLERIKSGDREAFMTITRLYQQKVFLLAFSCFRNREDALDIVQETFLRFYQKIHLYKKGNKFQSWLLQMAKNICVDYYRKHYRKIWAYGQDEDIATLSYPVDNPRASQQASDIKHVVDKCLGKLTEKQRMVFVLKHYNQLEYKEIAEVLNIALGTVKSLHHKAVRNLRFLMRPHLGRQA